MAREPPHKRRRTHHFTLKDEDADELLRRFQQQHTTAPPPSNAARCATATSSPVSSSRPTSSRSSDSEEGEIKEHNEVGHSNGTDEKLGTESVAKPKRTYTQALRTVAVPRFGEGVLRLLSGKKDSDAKDMVPKKPSKRQRRIQNKAKAALPRPLPARGSGSQKERNKGKINASRTNGRSKCVGKSASPHPESSEQNTNGVVKEARSASLSRPQETTPSVLENDNTDGKIAHQRKYRDLLTVKSFWDDEAYIRYKNVSPGTAELLGSMSRQFNEETARHYILNEVLMRMHKPELAQSRRIRARGGPEITCGDAKKARDKMRARTRALGSRLEDPKDLQPPELDAELLRKFNLQKGASGLLEPVPAQARLTENVSAAEPAELRSASLEEPTKRKSAAPRLAASNSPAPLPKKESEPLGKIPSFSLRSLKNEDVIDLTIDDPLAATNAPPVKSTPKPKHKLPSASEAITIGSYSSTKRRMTPAAAEQSRTSDSKSGEKADGKSNEISAIKPTENATSSSRRASTPLPTYTLMPRRKKRTFSAANESEGRQTPTNLQPASARAPVEHQQQPVRQASGDKQTSTVPKSKLQGDDQAFSTPPTQVGKQAPSTTQQAQSGFQTPINKHVSNANSTPVANQSPGSACSAEVQSTPLSNQRNSGYTREEDCLMVYLKTVFGYGPSKFADALGGRTPGACATRWSTKLRHGQIPLRKAIDCLERSSKFRHHLDPVRHDAILSRLPEASTSATLAMAMTHPSQGKARHAPPASLPFNNSFMTEDEGSDQSHSAASGRDRERRARKAVNYNVKAYFSGANIHRDDEPSDEVAPPVQSVTQGIQILPKVAKLKNSYKYAKPYLASHERKFLCQGSNAGTWDGNELIEWCGTSVHVGLSLQELRELQKMADEILGQSEISQSHPKKRFEATMRGSTEADIFEIAALASHSKALSYRSKESIKAALRDAQDGCLDDAQMTLDCHATTPTVASMIRHRELGMGRRNVSVKLKTKVYDTLGPSISFTGTSNDVNAVAWAPNGVQFAAGSTCHVDYDSMQYNRPNNLLFGNTHSSSLQELPQHHTLREKPAAGPNSQHSMHITQDRRLFQTVASVCFSPDGSSMYSAGYDGIVRFWDVTESGASQRLQMWRNAKVDLLAISKTGMLATAAQRTTSNAITVFDPDQSGDLGRWSISSFTSRKAAECPGNKIYPSTIRFDPYDGECLLAGFASTSGEDQLRGESCLWNVNTGTQLHLFPETRNVFDVAWNPIRVNAPTFAVGCVAGTNVNRGVRSVVKMYDPRSSKKCMSTIELDCSALDMNDVMFCPFDDNYVVAGCTNGMTYVWDLRQTHKEMCLYSLVHGSPLIELADPSSRERLDTGVRFCSWGHDRRRFYTGSSDGLVKSWDLYRAPEDTFIRDVVQLNSGVMCGSFSPDYSSLLLGEVNGSIDVLQVGNDGRSIREADSFDLISAPDTKKPHTDANLDDADSGVAASKSLIETGQMVLAPMGGFPVRQALQGPNYAGPFDSGMDAEDLRDQSAAFQKRLVPTTDDKCTIKGCDDVKRFTEEECGDSGRWKERVPAAITLWRGSDDTDTTTRSGFKASMGIVTKQKCWVQGCSRRAFLHLEFSGVSDRKVDVTSCEVHHFGCLRGDETVTAKIGSQSSPSTRGSEYIKDNQAVPFFIVHCGVYRTDLLGYKKISNPPSCEVLEGGCHKQAWERPISRRARRLIYGSDSENDDNGIDEYYAGLWGMEEAPAAPPFLPQTPRPPSPGVSSSSALSDSLPSSLGHREATTINPTCSGKPSDTLPSFSSSSVGRPNDGAQHSNNVTVVGGGDDSDAMAVDFLGRWGRRFVVDVDNDGGSGAVQTQLQEILPDEYADVMDLATDQPAATIVESNGDSHGNKQGNAYGNNRTVTPDASKRAEADADADTPVPTVEGAGEGEDPHRATKPPSNVPSSQDSSSSRDSNKSRTPCVPM